MLHNFSQKFIGSFGLIVEEVTTETATGGGNGGGLKFGYFRIEIDQG